MHSVLAQCGAQVTVAATARAALEALDQAPFDVLVSDIAMPGEDGYDLIRAVRSLDGGVAGRSPRSRSPRTPGRKTAPRRSRPAISSTRPNRSSRRSWARRSPPSPAGSRQDEGTLRLSAPVVALPRAADRQPRDRFDQVSRLGFDVSE
ncbi:MAG: response regulator [Candidatus Rokuibacteriota bacterium]